MTNLSVFEKLQATNANAEIWWDSSPLIFPQWREKQLKNAPDEIVRDRWIGQLDRLLKLDDPVNSLVRGVTTNPSLIAQSVLDFPDFWAFETRTLLGSKAQPCVEETYWMVYQEAVRKAALAIMPIWRTSNGVFGWVSGQLDPRYMFDVDRMMEQSLQLAGLSPNLMVKVPGTQQGYEVIRRLSARGISINNTLSFTVPQFMCCINAVEQGKIEAAKRGVDLSKFRCVITHMIGRFGSQGDLIEESAVRDVNLSQTDIRWAEIAILKRIYGILRERKSPIKMLLSSLLADPASGITNTLSLHLEETAGANIAYTCKPDFISEIMAREGELDSFDSAAIDRDIPFASMNKLIQLPYFRKSYEPDGISIEDFARQPAFLATHSEVNRWTRRLIDFTARQIESRAYLLGNQRSSIAAE